MRQCFEREFGSRGETSLFYRHWPAETAEARGAIVLLHRGHEHSGRMAHLVQELNLPDFAFFAWDARGHGRSPGPRGDSPSVGTLVGDIERFVRHVRQQHGFPVERVAVIAQSLAAVLLAAWAHDYGARIRAMVLAAPAFRVRLYFPFARLLLRLGLMLRGNFFVQSYVRPRFLTRDPGRIESYKSDPLITRAISVRVLVGLDRLAKRVADDAEAITVPTQLLISGSDFVVDARPQHAFYERLGAGIKERHVFPGFYHDTLGERHRASAIERVRAFLLARFEEPVERRSLLMADRIGFTRRETDALATPLPAWSLEGLYWRFARGLLALGGKLSAGIRIGQATGFDSGASLDYVYRNVATGRGVLGKMVDRHYLDAVGWRGIRQRKVHVEELIREAIENLRTANRPVRIVDVAAGAGRYVLDAIDGAHAADDIELRDYLASNVIAARALAVDRGLSTITGFRRFDAFGEAQDSGRGPDQRFSIGVVSGLYELYSDNAAVRRSLERLASELVDGAYLIYTGQPWHPQLEFIARVLTSHRDGQAWIMRRRTQVELDELIMAAGFTKLAQRTDEDGIFTVSLAQKRGSAGRGLNQLAAGSARSCDGSNSTPVLG